MTFTDGAEVDRFVGGIFRTAMADPELAGKLARTGTVLRMRCSEPEVDLVLDLPAGEVHLSEGPRPATATMSMTGETANAFWQGKVNLTIAMARRKVTVEGSVGSLLALLPLTKGLQPAYVQSLRDAGRADLIL